MKINSDEPDPSDGQGGFFTSFTQTLQMMTEPQQCCTKKDLNYAYVKAVNLASVTSRLIEVLHVRGLLSPDEIGTILGCQVHSIE